MSEELSYTWLRGALEALLFVSDEPVSAATLAEQTEADQSQVCAALDELRERFEQENRGIQLREVAGGWRLFTHPAYHELIEKYVLSWDTRKLSAAAMETLAIVAYLQPLTRNDIAGVRGVNSDSPLNSLVEKGLVREAGTADTPGNPTLYATTRAFLEKFGLRSPDDLPCLEDFAPDDETCELIRERLSATRVSDAFAPEVDAETGAQTGEGKAALAQAPAAQAPAAQAATAQEIDAQMAEAMQAVLGTVEKIDFSKLHIDTDDE